MPAVPLTLALAAVLAPALAPLLQAVPPTPAVVPASPASPSTPTVARETAAQPNLDLGGYRLPLLREGSAISRVVGDLTQDPDEKLWLFRPLEAETGGLRREFVLMPSPVLEDLLRTHRLAGAPVQFEMTGRVFMYRGRNFLLADFAPAIMRFDAKEGETPAPTDKAQPTPSGADKFVPPAGAEGAEAQEDAIVDAIERRLEERVGRAPQSRPTERTTGSASRADAPLANGTRLTLRLGRLSRDPQAGSWRFVPQQNSGSGDPSLEILPCLLLEKLETTARESDAPPAILISGTVYAYEGRNYLLPTSFRRAREGRGIGG